MRKIIEEFSQSLQYAKIKIDNNETEEQAKKMLEERIKSKYPVYTVLKVVIKDMTEKDSFEKYKVMTMLFVPFDIKLVEEYRKILDVGDNVKIPDIERKKIIDKLAEVLNGKVVTPEELLEGKTPNEEELIELMKTLPKYDMEVAHIKADNILCSALIKLGYSKLVEEYRKISKVYS